MKANFMGSESPSLTMLYGDEIESEIEQAAGEYGVDADDVRSVIEENPELMGVGEGFANVFSAISSGVGQMAPGLASALQTIRGQAVPQTVTPATTPQTGAIETPFGRISPMMIAIPAIGIIGFMVLKKMNKKSRRVR